MITYFYWLVVVVLVLAALWGIGVGFRRWGAALATAAIIAGVGAIAYYFHYQQIFVKRWGGIMSVSVPAGQRHIGVTWKEDHLWVENYDPATNTCEFHEYSRGDLLQGTVLIKNCNPLNGAERPNQP